MFDAILIPVQVIAFAWLGGGALYQFIFSLAGRFYKSRQPEVLTEEMPQITVFIPAYREDAVILQTVKATLKSVYPSHLLEVIVIADQLQEKTVVDLKKLPVRVEQVQFESSTKAKSLRAAISSLQKDHKIRQVAVVLDADNIPASDFMLRVARNYNAGFQAIQGRRAPKNRQTGLALLDAASEDINNHILCKGHRFLGLSARLAGSGMAFDYALFALTMEKIDAIGGFDKALELELTANGIQIAYDDQAIVYDEKVSQSSSFTSQRSRWIAAQFRYAKQFLPRGFRALLFNGKVDFFNKSIQMALPPRLLLPGILTVLTVIHLFLPTAVFKIWGYALTINILSFLLAMPSYVFQAKNLHIWLEIPKAFWATLRALTRLREANRRFIVTPKTYLAESADQFSSI